MNILLQSEENALQRAIMAQTRHFLGCRFVHQGRGADGVDCLGLLIAVARVLHLADRQGKPLAAQDTCHYGWQPCAKQLQTTLEAALVPVPMAAPHVADIALFSIQNNPQHLAILSRLPDGRMGMIHAYSPIGRVVEHALEGPWPRRLHQLYRLPDVIHMADAVR